VFAVGAGSEPAAIRALIRDWTVASLTLAVDLLSTIPATAVPDPMLLYCASILYSGLPPTTAG
jgi:hypothetical protein